MISKSRRILISAPQDSVKLYLRELMNMATYEPRIESVQVLESQGEEARVAASGRFLVVPWSGEFDISFTRDGGYHCSMVSGPLRRMECVYHLRPVSGGTVLTHEEHYLFPVLLRPLAWAISSWLIRSIDLELGAIKEGAELLNRRIQLQRLQSS